MGQGGSYRAETSQKSYVQRRRASIPVGKWTPELAGIIEDKLQATWSPEQITERHRQEGQEFVCFKTIYRWLYSGLLVKGTLAVLRHKGKRQKPSETRGKFAVGKSISQRPKEVRSRGTFGHWELDTVVSGRGKSKGCVATFIERKTRLYTAIRMPDRTALSMEIACYANLEATHGVQVYLQTPIPPGNEAQTRMPMASCKSSFLKERISLKLRMNPYTMLWI